MVIGFDLDGVLARERHWPFRLPGFLFRWLLVFAPAMPGIEVARRLAKRHRLVVVSSRSQECYLVSWLWLQLNRLPVALYCVGKNDKTTCLKRKGVEIFFDDKSRYVEAARSQGVTAHLFTSWSRVAKLLDLPEELPALGLVHRFVSSSAIGRRLKKRLCCWMADCPGWGILWQNVVWTDEPPLETSVNQERIVCRRLAKPLKVYHVTSSEAVKQATADGLRPSAQYCHYADKAGEDAMPVIFFYLSRRAARRFVFLGSWPLRLVFDFCTSRKNRILEVVIPAGNRIGITSWHEVICLDLIPPENVQPRAEGGLDESVVRVV